MPTDSNVSLPAPRRRRIRSPLPSPRPPQPTATTAQQSPATPSKLPNSVTWIPQRQAFPLSPPWYTSDMNEHNIEERFDRLEKKVDDGFARADERFAQVTSRMEAGFAHVNSLIDSLATLCAREFIAIQEHFTEVEGRLEVIDEKIEAFGRRLDHEAEQRHALGERVSKLEQSV
jgi:tetrahydromethanopterin S-methyltransferase subunit G